MATDDLVDTLKAAIERADPNWVTQPSHLRRRLDDELGADARALRARVHQLVVGAEERVPVRLGRDGWSPEAREELVSRLVATRGWTSAAADWTVVTWAGAMGLTDERPIEQEPLPANRAQRTAPPRVHDVDAVSAGSMPSATELPSETELPGATELPSATVLPAATELPGATVLPAAAVLPDATVLPGATTTSAPSATELPAAPDADVDSGPPAVPSTQLPTRGTAKCTAKTAAFLEREIDVAYEVSTGASPAWLLLALPIGLASFASPMLAGPLLMAFVLIIAIGRAVWPKRILAIGGNQVWVLTARGRVVRPTGIESESTRDRVEPAGGWPFPAVRVEGRRLWFFFPNRSAARLVPAPGGLGAS